MQRKVVAEKVIVAIAAFCPGVGGSSASGDFCAESHKDTGSSHDLSTCSSPISSTIHEKTELIPIGNKFGFFVYIQDITY